MSGDFSVVNGGIYYKNDTLFDIKGVSWFGYETCDFVFHGLWAHPMTWYLDFLQQHSFNLIRLPFSQEWVVHGFESQRPSFKSVEADPALQGKTSLEILDIFFEECRRRGIFVLLDMHRLRCDGQSHEVWYSLDGSGYTSETFFAAWEKMLYRYGGSVNLHGVDILNEPRGIAQWGTNPSTSWNLFVESVVYNLPNYDGLVYVEGTNWGKSFEGMRNFPISVDQSRVVFSPHVYGPSVVGDIDLDPGRLQFGWEKEFGYLVPQGQACTIGEFGGRYVGADRAWNDRFVDYLVSLNVSGIFWCVNPNSGDTGGLLADDWSTPMWEKLKLLQRLQPFPTIVDFDAHNTRRNLRIEEG